MKKKQVVKQLAARVKDYEQTLNRVSGTKFGKGYNKPGSMSGKK